MHSIVKKGCLENSSLPKESELGAWLKQELQDALESLVELEISRQPPGTDLELIVEIVKESEEYQKVHTRNGSWM